MASQQCPDCVVRVGCDRGPGCGHDRPTDPLATDAGAVMIEMPTESEPVRIVQGDCLTLLRQISDKCVDFVLTDPPYGISYQSARRIDKSQRKPKIANDSHPFVWWLFDAARVLTDGGGLLCFCRWDVQEAFRLAIGWAGLTVRAQLIWDRVGHGAGDPAVSPAPCHDVIWYATKGRRVFSGTRPKSIVRATRIGGAKLRHPNEKPEPLLRQLVQSYTAPEELILDPFAGSGTTGVAAAVEGRRCLLMELNSEYVQFARDRVANALFPGLFSGDPVNA